MMFIVVVVVVPERKLLRVGTTNGTIGVSGKEGDERVEVLVVDPSFATQEMLHKNVSDINVFK